MAERDRAAVDVDPLGVDAESRLDWRATDANASLISIAVDVGGRRPAFSSAICAAARRHAASESCRFAV